VNPFDKAMLKLLKAVEGADAVVAPLALGGHVDHRTAREATAAMATGAKPWAFYEDLPDALEAGEAEIERSAQAIGADLVPLFASAEGDVETAIQRKRRLALCYDSQIEDATAEGMAAYCGRFGGRERLWANTAWRASELAV
jgi:LmbE family N-acetylglucosaminyl deacetylase